MFKKVLAAAAVAVLFSNSAFALTNPGFESGDTTGWNQIGLPPAIAGDLQALATGSLVEVVDDYYLAPAAVVYDVNITAQHGSYFGLLTPTAGSMSAYQTNLAGPVSQPYDLLWLRLLSAEYEFDLSGNIAYNDYVKVSYFGAGGVTALASDEWSVQDTQDLVGPLFSPFDSGWRGFYVPVGTQSIVVEVHNVGDNKLAPIVALDYAPVPEPESLAMMLAGLGALGFMSRRRRTK